MQIKCNISKLSEIVKTWKLKSQFKVPEINAMYANQNESNHLCNELKIYFKVIKFGWQFDSSGSSGSERFLNCRSVRFLGLCGCFSLCDRLFRRSWRNVNVNRRVQVIFHIEFGWFVRIMTLLRGAQILTVSTINLAIDVDKIWSLSNWFDTSSKTPMFIIVGW